MTTDQRQNRIMTAFILLSLLLHLLLLLVPKHKLFPTESIPEPVYVEVRPPQQRERELDLPIRKELEQPRIKPAKRLAERDQVVEKELAPEGKDSEDRPKMVRAPKTEAAPRVQPQPQPSQEVAPQREEPTPAPVTTEGWLPPTEQKPARPLPDLQTLTQLSPDTLAKVEKELRRKYRSEVDKGDTVWMDTEQDLLYSFMRRFRANIYGVWNYPAEAAQRAQQGTCLLRITVDRQGNVTNVQLLESSGFRILDEEAILAVRQGATYGPLPRSYPNEDLKIMAFFQYRASNTSRRERRPRPGEIF